MKLAETEATPTDSHPIEPGYPTIEDRTNSHFLPDKRVKPQNLDPAPTL